MENNTERDKFAKSIGVQVIEALPERAVCKLEINENQKSVSKNLRIDLEEDLKNLIQKYC